VRGAGRLVIASLAGTLVEKTPDRLLIEVGGVGYAVHVSLQTFTGLPPTGTAVRLLVHTEVREDAIELVGFASVSERTLFHLLRKVKGLGPKTCLTVLSGLPVRELVAVMAAGDAARLQTIPGVGKRLAERIIVECREEAIKLSPRGRDAAAAGRARGHAAGAGGLGPHEPRLQAARRRPGGPEGQCVRHVTRRHHSRRAPALERVNRGRSG